MRKQRNPKSSRKGRAAEVYVRDWLYFNGWSVMDQQTHTKSQIRGIDLMVNRMNSTFTIEVKYTCYTFNPEMWPFLIPRQKPEADYIFVLFYCGTLLAIKTSAIAKAYHNSSVPKRIVYFENGDSKTELKLSMKKFSSKDYKILTGPWKNQTF